MSHAPGLDLETRSDPGDATKGVIIEAAATGDPDRSWIVIIQPFLSLPCFFSHCSPDNVLVIHPLLLYVKPDGKDLTKHTKILNTNCKIVTKFVKFKY